MKLKYRLQRWFGFGPRIIHAAPGVNPLDEPLTYHRHAGKRQFFWYGVFGIALLGSGWFAWNAYAAQHPMEPAATAVITVIANATESQATEYAGFVNQAAVLFGDVTTAPTHAPILDTPTLTLTPTQSPTWTPFTFYTSVAIWTPGPAREVTRLVPVEVPVDRWYTQVVEVTRIVDRTQIIIVTQRVEQTRIVLLTVPYLITATPGSTQTPWIVTATFTPTFTPSPTPTPTWTASSSPTDTATLDMSTEITADTATATETTTPTPSETSTP